MSLSSLSGPQGPVLEAKAEFVLRLRARGIRELGVLRAMEAVPRDVFGPHRYADLAGKDVALPLPCGQTMAEPFVVARMLEALGPTSSCRVLEIGAGSGYVTALLARLGGDVLGVERFRTLVIYAKTRLAALGVANAAVVWGDGLAVPPDAGPFDRILVHAELPEIPACLAALLGEGGAIVFARRGLLGDNRRQHLVRAERSRDGGWTEDPVAPSRLRPLFDGPSRGL